MKARNWIIPLAVSALSACGGGGGGNESSLPPGQVSAFEGIWTSAVNGQSYAIKNDSLSVYQHDSQFCVVTETISGVGEDELYDNFELLEGGRQLAIRGSDGTPDLHAPKVRFARMDALPTPCDAPVTTVGTEGYQRDPIRDLAIFSQTFKDYYLSFELKGVDWDSSVQTAQALVSSSTTDAELMELLYQLAMPLADAHVQVYSPSQGGFSADGKRTLVGRLIDEYAQLNGITEPLSQEEIDALNDYIDAQLSLREDILRGYAGNAPVHSAGNGQLTWFIVDNIAYLEIGAMTGFAGDGDAAAQLTALETALDRVLEDIQDVRGLVIDIRLNNGGQDFLSMAIASRFISQETLGFAKQSREGNHRSALEEVFIQPRGENQYLGPIALLTSNSTVSAAEVFALIMRSRPAVTLIGERTQGALSDSLEKILPNGIEFSLSNQFYFSAEGEWFEHTGIPVDVETPFFSAQERQARIDLGLEAAINQLIGGGQ